MNALIIVMPVYIKLSQICKVKFCILTSSVFDTIPLSKDSHSLFLQCIVLLLSILSENDKFLLDKS